MNENDVKLYHQVEQGDKQALEALYDRYEKLLYSFSYRMTGQKELAEDVVHEVFIKLWTKKGIYDKTKGKFSSWLLTVARNTSIDLIRKKKETTYTIAERDSVHNNDQATEDLLEWKEEGQHLRRAVSLLKKEQQEVIDLFYFKGFSQQKISEACKIPLGTVKGRIRLALQHLRKNLSNSKERGI